MDQELINASDQDGRYPEWMPRRQEPERNPSDAPVVHDATSLVGESQRLEMWTNEELKEFSQRGSERSYLESLGRAPDLHREYIGQIEDLWNFFPDNPHRVFSRRQSCKNFCFESVISLTLFESKKALFSPKTSLPNLKHRLGIEHLDIPDETISR